MVVVMVVVTHLARLCDQMRGRGGGRGRRRRRWHGVVRHRHVGRSTCGGRGCGSQLNGAAGGDGGRGDYVVAERGPRLRRGHGVRGLEAVVNGQRVVH